MIEMDIYYSRNASFWLDVTILLRTVPAILWQVFESRVGLGRKIREGLLAREARGSLSEPSSSSGSEV
jgi:hypothetical protein